MRRTGKGKTSPNTVIVGIRMPKSGERGEAMRLLARHRARLVLASADGDVSMGEAFLDAMRSVERAADAGGG